jgi:hypothetical protein
MIVLTLAMLSGASCGSHQLADGAAAPPVVGRVIDGRSGDWLDAVYGSMAVVDGRVVGSVGETMDQPPDGEPKDWPTASGQRHVIVEASSAASPISDSAVNAERFVAFDKDLADGSFDLQQGKIVLDEDIEYRFLIAWNEVNGRSWHVIKWAWDIEAEEPASGSDVDGFIDDLSLLRSEGLLPDSDIEAVLTIATAVSATAPSPEQETIRSLLEYPFAPVQTPADLVPTGYWPVMPDERGEDANFVEVAVTVLGADDGGRLYGLRGEKLLGWATPTQGYVQIVGWMPPGAAAELVTSDETLEAKQISSVLVSGTPVKVTAKEAGLFALIDIRNGPAVITLHDSLADLSKATYELMDVATSTPG